MTTTEIVFYIGSLLASYLVGMKVGVAVRFIKNLGNSA